MNNKLKLIFVPGVIALFAGIISFIVEILVYGYVTLETTPNPILNMTGNALLVVGAVWICFMLIVTVAIATLKKEKTKNE